MLKNIADIRINYSKQSLDEKMAKKDALDMFKFWWEEAINSDITEVNAMTLATVNEGVPNARVVLLKGFDERGFVFFTNYNSQKGNDLKGNNNVCLVIFWKELERQIRITGKAEKTTAQESIDYFNSRPDGSKIGAWASAQSLIVAGKSFLKETFQYYNERFKHGVIPMPPHWGGYRVKPEAIEFWQGRPSRMHDRLLYNLQDDKTWSIKRLQP